MAIGHRDGEVALRMMGASDEKMRAQRKHTSISAAMSAAATGSRYNFLPFARPFKTGSDAKGSFTGLPVSADL